MTERPGWVYGIILLIGTVFGILLIGAVRYATQESYEGVHYHANWAVFVDGQRLDLTANRYMEDVFQCTVDPTQQRPEDRVHMHENNHDVVHVHAAGVTWGHFIDNLGFGMGDDYLYTDAARYESAEDRSLKFVLNGTEVRTIRNRAIRDQDRLVISFGPETIDEVLAVQYPQVAVDAHHYNTMPDPASCAGPQNETTADRLRRAFWF
jgi:hypothetical protein